MVLEKAGQITSRGFWSALKDIQANRAFIIAPVKKSYPIQNKVMVTSLSGFFRKFKN